MSISVAVMGAGAAGLCCARYLSRHPSVFRFSVFEQSDRIGGTWVYTEKTGPDEYGLPVHGSMYRDLITNLPKEIMLFPGFPFRSDLPSFVTHSDMLDYLQHYTEHYDLHKHVQFHTVVEGICPLPLSHSLPALHASGTEYGSRSSSAYQNSVWTNSENGIGTNFENGSRINSGDGAGSSPGNELENKANIQGDNVKWSVTYKNLRSGTVQKNIYDAVIVCNGHFSTPVVTDIDGLSDFPGQVLHSHWYRIPETFTNQRVLIVGPGPSGVDIMVNVSHFAASVYLVYHRNPLPFRIPSNAEQFPCVSKVEIDGTVLFENGASRKCDAIILCTGYKYTFPFLSPDTGIQIEAGKRVTPLYKDIFNALHPSMAFVSLNKNIVPFPLFDVQVRLIVAMFSGKRCLPSSERMISELEDEWARKQSLGVPLSHAHNIKDEYEYSCELAKLGGFEPLDRSFAVLRRMCKRDKKSDVLNYKKYDYSLEEEGEDIIYTRTLRPGQTLI